MTEPRLSLKIPSRRNTNYWCLIKTNHVSDHPPSSLFAMEEERRKKASPDKRKNTRQEKMIHMTLHVSSPVPSHPVPFRSVPFRSVPPNNYHTIPYHVPSHQTSTTKTSNNNDERGERSTVHNEQRSRSNGVKTYVCQDLTPISPYTLLIT